MLTRLYVDNFRCLENFELELEEANVLLGSGTGKTSVLNVLSNIQNLVVRGARVEEVFPARDLLQPDPSLFGPPSITLHRRTRQLPRPWRGSALARRGGRAGRGILGTGSRRLASPGDDRLPCGSRRQVVLPRRRRPCAGEQGTEECRRRSVAVRDHGETVGMSVAIVLLCDSCAAGSSRLATSGRCLFHTAPNPPSNGCGQSTQTN